LCLNCGEITEKKANLNLQVSVQNENGSSCNFIDIGRRYKMKVKGIVWLGTRTDKFNAMVNLYQNIMGLEVVHREPGFVVIDLPNGDRVEVFGTDSPYNTFFTNPVAGFLVDNDSDGRILFDHGVDRSCTSLPDPHLEPDLHLAFDCPDVIRFHLYERV